MPIGDTLSGAPSRTPCLPGGGRARPVRGFTYLLLLFTVAVAGAGLATLGTQWQLAAQREREAELLFRAGQLRDALQRYHDATPAGQPRLPQTLDQLLLDERGPEPLHHLRRRFVDPFADPLVEAPADPLADPDGGWQLLRDAHGGIVGLHSRSTRPALRQQGLPPGVRVHRAPSGPERDTQVRDWHFVIQPRPANHKARP